jgi:hypothetical protein
MQKKTSKIAIFYLHPLPPILSLSLSRRFPCFLHQCVELAAAPCLVAFNWSSRPPRMPPPPGAHGRRPWSLRTPRSPPSLEFAASAAASPGSPLPPLGLEPVAQRSRGPTPVGAAGRTGGAAHPAGHRGAPRRRRARHRRRRVVVLLRAVVQADAGQRQRARQLRKGRRSCSSTPWRSGRRRSYCLRRLTGHGRSPSASCSTKRALSASWARTGSSRSRAPSRR